jgi:hypothetical protein
MSTKQTATEQIQHLPQEILLSLARNPSADRAFAKAAVKLLIQMKSRYADHPELALTAAEIRRESEAETEVEAIVESATEQEIPKSKQPATNYRYTPASDGALRASVTTKTMFQEPVIRNPKALAVDALGDE